MAPPIKTIRQLDIQGYYEKDDETKVQEHVVGGITHYIATNNEITSVMWTNGNIEGHMVGAISVDDMERMVDSIYN